MYFVRVRPNCAMQSNAHFAFPSSHYYYPTSFSSICNFRFVISVLFLFFFHFKFHFDSETFVYLIWLALCDFLPPDSHKSCAFRLVGRSIGRFGVCDIIKADTFTFFGLIRVYLLYSFVLQLRVRAQCCVLVRYFPNIFFFGFKACALQNNRCLKQGLCHFHNLQRK